MLTYKAMLDGIKSYGLHTGLKPSNGEPMPTNDMSTNLTAGRRTWHGPYYVYCLNAASSLSGDTRHGSGMWSTEKKEAEFAKAVSALPPVEYNGNGECVCRLTAPRGRPCTTPSGLSTPTARRWGWGPASITTSCWTACGGCTRPVHTALTQTGR